MHTILITGAGSGIGKASAQRLASNPNNRLILVGRTLEKLEDVLVTLDNKNNHLTHSLDVSKKDELINFLNSSKARRSIRREIAISFSTLSDVLALLPQN